MAEKQMRGSDQLGDPPPDGARTAAPGESKAMVRPPRDVVAVFGDVPSDAREIRDGDALTHPGRAHALGRHAPDLGVVWVEEEPGDAVAKRRVDPLAEVRGRGHRTSRGGALEPAQRE